ncbi:MAG: peptide chain release factor N(5)-glutamine methyltransferase [Eubacterium sp.]|nr:peptide chain release factor N(5)-glutamine methyltransferase [Eubacterium sp.]
MTLKQAYNYCADALRERGIDEAEFKALCIVCSSADIKNGEYAFHINDTVDSRSVKEMFERLLSGEPLQYVIGKWDFFESEFYVGKGVLIPRPETEELVELALKRCAAFTNPVILDLCAGSGCIGLSIAKKLDCTVYLVEKSNEAFKYLERNSKSIKNAITVKADITINTDLPDADIIISNPPYVRSSELKSLQSDVLREPEVALDGGPDGLYFYREINRLWLNKLKKNGLLLLEIGNEQGSDVLDIFSSLEDKEIIKDIYGNDRIFSAVKR